MKNPEFITAWIFGFKFTPFKQKTMLHSGLTRVNDTGVLKIVRLVRIWWLNDGHCTFDQWLIDVKDLLVGWRVRIAPEVEPCCPTVRVSPVEGSIQGNQTMENSFSSI